MEKRLHLYVSNKHPALWLAVLCLLASAAARIAVFSLRGTFGLWRHIIWPVVATLLFGLLAVLGGRERLYRTAIPFWMLGVCAAWQLHRLFGGIPVIYAMICLCILFFCISYTSVISGRHKPWLLLPMYLILLGAAGAVHLQLRQQPLAFFYVLPEYLLLTGLLVMLFALRVHTDGKYHPTWGDRADGRLIRSTLPILISFSLLPFAESIRTRIQSSSASRIVLVPCFVLPYIAISASSQSSFRSRITGFPMYP